ncbi:hypothetical protein HU200_005909 [Digitaria exilis]|uniref:Uncharacterized protein n=1 Tax=Digitaria exilis TaxID=1010633 RepID=A0A835FR72_9POAL|nr:hypothetical protein HU200_005909 [Digitaria exilis]
MASSAPRLMCSLASRRQRTTKLAGFTSTVGEVDTARLGRLWIAEQFIAEGRATNAEETATSYLNELIGRNMVLHLIHDGTPSYCKLHPMMYDFIVCKAMEENFATLVDDKSRAVSINHNTVYRLSVQSSKQGPDLEQNGARNLSRVRSIIVFAQASAPPRLADLRFIRVLDLEGCNGPLCLDGLDKLLLLRYLGLRGTGISELPASIWELRCLETLDVRSTKVKELPRSIRRLRETLTTLLFSNEGTLNSPTGTATRIAEDIQDCHKLENLATIDLREHRASFLKILGALVNLRMITIIWSFQQCTDESYCEALVSCIEKWRNLRSLTIHCGLSCSMDFLGSLSHLPELLEKLMVTGGGFLSVPKLIENLDFLRVLQINVCRLAIDDLNILRDLPQLQLLILGLDFVPREAIEIEAAGFSELLRFSVNCPVPWLIFRTGAMPKLTHLQLEFCSGSASQNSFPYGIGNLQRLTEVSLLYNQKWCANISSVRRTLDAVKRQVVKHRNPINLIVNDTKDDVQEEVVEETKMTTIIQSGDVQQDGEVIARARIETWGEIEIEPEGDNINDA